jgi:hypothetical protein
VSSTAQSWASSPVNTPSLRPDAEGQSGHRCLHRSTRWVRRDYRPLVQRAVFRNGVDHMAYGLSAVARIVHRADGTRRHRAMGIAAAGSARGRHRTTPVRR